MERTRRESEKGMLYFLGAAGAIALALLSDRLSLRGIGSALPGLLFAAGFAFSLFGLLHGVKSIRRGEARTAAWWAAVLGNGLLMLYFLGMVLYNELY